MNDITVSARPSKRQAYWVVPDPDDPVIFQLDGALTRVVDISALGISVSEDSVKSGRRYPFSLDLPSGSSPITGYVDVMPDTDTGFAHCKFVDLNAEDIDSLHHYVLIRQKEAIRALRANKLNSLA
jgi:hypothetical protein